MHTVSEMVRTNPQPAPMRRDALIQVIEVCMLCEQTCAACADACLGEEEIGHLRRCIRINCARNSAIRLDDERSSGRIRARSPCFRWIGSTTIRHCVSTTSRFIRVGVLGSHRTISPLTPISNWFHPTPEPASLTGPCL